MADERFKTSIAGFSQTLGERMAAHPDPVGEAIERRLAVQAEFARQEQRMKWMLRAGAAAMALCVAACIVYFTRPQTPATIAVAEVPPPAAAAAPEPAVVTPVSAPEPAVAAAPTPAVASPAVSSPAASSPVASAPASAPAPAPEAAPAPPLGRDDVREVQMRLYRLGFDPGPADGDAGPMTQAAITRYQQKRELPETGTPDRALLDQLRQDPAPPVEMPRQVAQRRGWHDASRAQPTAAPSRPSGFLDSIREADSRLSRWLNGR